MNYIIEGAQELSVVGEYDVAVFGGGPAGVAAATAAAKTGAKTTIIERYGYLGGQATGGLVILLVGLTDGKEQIIKGICKDTIKKLKQVSRIERIGPHILFDPEALKLVFDDFITENNIKPYYHTFLSNAVIYDNMVSAAVIDGKSGRGIIKAKVYIDATGDGDFSKFCGLPFLQEKKEKLLPVTLGIRVGGLDTEKVKKYINENHEKYQNILKDLNLSNLMGGWIPTLHKGEAWFNIVHAQNIDCTDTQDLTHAEIQTRKAVHKLINIFQKEIEGFENGYLIDTSAQMGVRDSRRIKGLHFFTKEDADKNFDDAIARAPNYITGVQGSVQVPYGCMVTRKMNNLIFAGRCISIDHELFGMFREIPCCMATGHAAGVAAALACKDDTVINIKKIDISQLQGILLEQGAVIWI